MGKLQKMGGVAALVQASTFLVGFALYFTLLSSARYGSADIAPIKHVEFLAAHQAIMYAWNFVIYVAFGIFLVVLALALHERLRANSPSLAQVGTAFGLIWAGLVIASGMIANIGAELIVDLYSRDPAQAASVWLSLNFVVNGLGGGNEIVGGLWVLLVSCAAWNSTALPRALNYLGVVSGAAGLLTVIPPLGEVGAIFGMGLIVWFIWLGIVLLRSELTHEQVLQSGPLQRATRT